MNFLDTIKYIATLSLEEKSWLVVFYIGSIISWFAIRLVPMQSIAGLMGQHLDNRTLCMLANNTQASKATRMGQLVNMVANNTPWKFQCLAQALCIKWLLNRYKIPSVFYLGALLTKNTTPEMKAHAWVEVREHTIIGSPQHKHYKVIASFVTPKLKY